MKKLIILLLLLFLCIIPFHVQADPVDVGNDWGFWGDSHTDSTAGNVPYWIDITAPTPLGTYWNGGLSASSLAAGITRYEAYAGNGNFTWVHFQESGNQNRPGQQTASDFGDTFEDAVNSILTNSPNAVISYETAFSFGREAEDYRNWDSYNVELRSRIASLAAEGKTVILCDTDSNIKALQTEIDDAREVWCQSDEGCSYHYKDLGNFMIAMSLWSALGYTRNDVTLTNTSVLALDPTYMQAALDIAFTTGVTTFNGNINWNQ